MKSGYKELSVAILPSSRGSELEGYKISYGVNKKLIMPFTGENVGRLGQVVKSKCKPCWKKFWLFQRKIQNHE